MKLFPTLFLLGLCVFLCTPLTATNEKSIEQMESEIALVKEHLTLREKRANDVLQDILDLDKDVETQIDVITQKLASIRDSKDSRITVLQTKEKVIEGLKNLVAYYHQERSLMEKEMQKHYPQAQGEDLKDMAHAYDEKIEKRVEQIITLTQSLETHQDLPKYIEHRDGWGNTWKEKNKDYKMQQQVDNRTTATRKKLIEAIDSAVQRLENETAELERELNYYTPQEQELIKEMIERNKETIARRKQQKLEIIGGGSAPSGQQTVSRSSAHELTKMIDAAGNNLRTDIVRLSNLSKQYLAEKQAVASLKQNLTQREAELAKARES